jgi:hypothetical protein
MVWSMRSKFNVEVISAHIIESFRISTCARPSTNWRCAGRWKRFRLDCSVRKIIVVEWFAVRLVDGLDDSDDGIRGP